ncbi:MAG: beta-ketoacyl-ACP synthase II [Clostridia bacterium]|nr:beta-ketoacyl-ACP synthase II [Clostridia bacterium]
MSHRVVVTGMGVVSPIGSTLDSFWKAAVEGKSGITPITRFDCSQMATRIAGEVKDFDPHTYIDHKESRRMDRFTQFAVASAKMAVEDAGLDLDREDLTRIGVIFGTGVGGIETFEEQFQVLQAKGPSRISPFFIPMMIANMGAGQISIVLGLKGPNLTVVNACASATNAIGEAFRAVQRGEMAVAITGGSEASLTPLAIAGFCSMRAMSVRNNEPERASRPFDRERDGFVLSEGAGALVLESWEHAQQRNAKVYAEVIGYGCTADAFHISAPQPQGEGAIQAMKLALTDAGVAAEEVGYINAHGTSTDLNDKIETLAIKQVFGDHARRLQVSSTKSVTGHLLGAAGAIEAIATCLALKREVIPPTINYEYPDPECDLDYVPNQARQAKITVALSNSFGFGGHNAVLAFRRL